MPATRVGAAAIVFDLDHFKRINDILGHSAGDEVLRKFAALLKEAAGPADRAARLGGEEFALRLGDTDLSTALQTAETIRRRLGESFRHLTVPVSVSAGVAAVAGDAEDGDLLRDASRALNAAKRLGRNRSIVYDARTVELLAELVDERADEQIAAAILLAETLDLRDPATAQHSKTVGSLAQATAARLGFSPQEVERVRIAGLVHDLGKIGISDAVLLKPGRLTEDEFAEIERHPEIGARILEHANLPEIAAWVLDHHERIDGHGYPRGLAGEEIPIESRILAVADSYEAMIAERPYREGLGFDEAIAELERCAGTQFDRQVVQALLAVLRTPSIGEPSPRTRGITRPPQIRMPAG